ncbi:MAG: hypothetical protein E6G60_15380, partial [Actinobacteria bacterium]
MAGDDDDLRLEIVDLVDRPLEQVRQEVRTAAVEIRDLGDHERARSVARGDHARSVGASEAAATLLQGDVGNPGFPGISRPGATPLRQPRRARVREGARLLRRPLGVRAEDVRARAGRERTGRRGLQAGLLSAGAGPVRRGDRDEAVAGHAQEPQAAQASRAVSGREGQALLQARRRAPGRAIPPRARLLDRRHEVGDVYLSREELQLRVRELGRELVRDYEGREPLLVAPLKASVVFVADLSRATRIPHALDFVELASYGADADTGGHARIRFLKDLDSEIAGRHVLIVEDVIDTGLTLNYL